MRRVLPSSNESTSRTLDTRIVPQGSSCAVLPWLYSFSRFSSSTFMFTSPPSTFSRISGRNSLLTFKETVKRIKCWYGSLNDLIMHDCPERHYFLRAPEVEHSNHLLWTSSAQRNGFKTGDTLQNHHGEHAVYSRYNTIRLRGCVTQHLCGNQVKPVYVHLAQKAASVWLCGRMRADAASILKQLIHGSSTNKSSLSVPMASLYDLRTHAFFFHEYAEPGQAKDGRKRLNSVDPVAPPSPPCL